MQDDTDQKTFIELGFSHSLANKLIDILLLK